MDVDSDLAEALRLLEPHRDLLLDRPAEEADPDWAVARGWVDELAAIPEEALAEAERAPADWLTANGPASFRRVAQRAAALEARYRGARPPVGEERWRHVKERKRAQIQAFIEAAERYPRVDRLVDFGSGHGHLTRALSRELEPAEALGVERRADFVERARALGGRFVDADAEGFALRSGDLVVGLHSCGSLGDGLVRRAREGGAHALLVSCCYQKVEGQERRWLSAEARGFVLPRHVLGLANLAPRSFDGSGSLEAKQRWRRTRLAVRLALRRRGVEVAPGDEARGVTKERFRAGPETAAARAFERRGLTPPTAPELTEAEAGAVRLHARIARFALPRHALARVLELAIVLDRARYLAEGGWDTEVRPLFAAATSPRNLAILAHAPS